MKLHISLQPEVVHEFFGFPIANSLLLGVLVSALVLAAALLIARSLRMVPKKGQNVAEMLVGGILDFMEDTLGSREAAKMYLPYIAALFFFILFNNWLGILPGIGSIGFYEMKEGVKEFVPFFRSLNSDLNTTLALALVSVVAIQIYGMKKLGVWGHWSKFFNFREGPIHFFVGLLELVGEFAKVMSFSFRLFGNVFAGEVLLLIIMNLAPFFAPTPFLLLEIFVGFIQALVFAMLTLIFIKFATEGHGEAHAAPAH
ncbi:MAG: F0F1 ATP synthase subunit A [Candidatus Harrisonbacteria bacterium]|nr:F0F1 ATP synthase subunit A [Candidatus Harrisonbacteria bacterium]MBI2604416.1 F0F1 ATP synthase subunit A [Candidatus Harrisonbacteria bacterium]